MLDWNGRDAILSRTDNFSILLVECIFTDVSFKDVLLGIAAVKVHKRTMPLLHCFYLNGEVPYQA